MFGKMWCFLSLICVFSSFTNFVPVKSTPTPNYADNEIFKIHGTNFSGFPREVVPGNLKSLEFDLVHFETSVLLESLKDCHQLVSLNLTRVTYDKTFDRKIKLSNLDSFVLDLKDTPGLRTAEAAMAAIFFYKTNSSWETDQHSMKNIKRIQISEESKIRLAFDSNDQKLEANYFKTEVMHFFKEFNLNKFIISSSVVNPSFIPSTTKELRLNLYSDEILGSLSELFQRTVNLEKLEARIFIDRINISYSDLPSNLRTLLLRNFNLIPIPIHSSENARKTIPNLKSLILEKITFDGGNGSDFFEKCPNVKELALKGTMHMNLAVLKPLGVLKKLEFHSYLNLTQSSPLKFKDLESVYVEDSSIFSNEEFKLEFFKTIRQVKTLVILKYITHNLFKHFILTTEANEIFVAIATNPNEKDEEAIQVEAVLIDSGVPDLRYNSYVYLKSSSNDKWSDAGIPNFNKIWTWIEVQRNNEKFVI